MLREDEEAQAKADGEIVGIDFDPFLSGQDPKKHYEVRSVELRDGRFWVTAVPGGTTRSARSTAVVAELKESRGRFEFVNFHYPDGQDLVKVLKQLKVERTKAPAP